MTVWDEVLADAAALTQHPDNWDGEGATAVTLELASKVVDYLRAQREYGHEPPDYVYPLADGTVMLEYHTPEKTTAVNIRSDGSHEVLVRWSNGSVTFTVGRV